MAKAEVVPGWDDKAYLRYLPPHLQDRYRESVNDPELLDLSRQIALMDVYIKTLLQTVDQQELTKEQVADDLRLEFEHLAEDDVVNIAGFMMGYLPQGFMSRSTFAYYERLIDKIEAAQLDGRIREADRAKRMLFHGIRERRKDGEVWDDLKKTMEERRRLSEAEIRRRKDNQQTMPLDRVVMLAGIIVESVKESVMKYVADREVQQYILRDAERIYQRHLGMGNDRQADELAVD